MNRAASLFQIVNALREGQHGSGHVLQAAGVAEGLQGILPAELVTLNDLDLRRQQDVTLGLVDSDVPEEPFGSFWEHFAGSLTCSYTEREARLEREVMRTSDFYGDRQWHSTGMYAECMDPAGLDQELIMPLPAPPGIARRLVFFRPPGRKFSDAERDAAVLLQPHIAEALRVHGRRAAAQLLTRRQLQLLQLSAVGYDNNAIARQLIISPATVRKHLENAYARLGVTSRTAAAARAFPDITWS
jgi:DNA-binding CsgD family transcriptional regulator